MFTYLKKKTLAIYTAAKAGWIASRCKTGCVIDNEKEEIRSCFLHKAEMDRLERINMQNQ